MFETCNLYIDCADANKHLSTEELFRLLIKVDENGCPALNIEGSLAVVPGAPAAKTPTSVVTTGAGNVPAGATEVSIANIGNGNASSNGQTHPPGIIRKFGFSNPISAAIPYDGGGAHLLLIDYMI